MSEAKKDGQVASGKSQLDELKNLPIADFMRRLETTEQGLSNETAKKRLEQFGFNELQEKKTSPLVQFLSHFWGPIAWMIEVAAILSVVVHHWPEFWIIMVLLVMNAVVGFWEEFQANNTIEALKSKLAIKARVKRDGQWTSVPARELVPGDIIRIRLGDVIPADARLYQGDEVQVDQSALTGESLPVTRKQGDAVYSGSILKQGEVDAVVYGTGQNTYFGKTAELVQSAHKESHFQKAVLKIGDFLIVIALALVILILVVAVFRGDQFMTTLQFALILTVAAIPVAMPAVLSVTMAVGARKLAEKKAIVTRLASIEEMAGADILCSDKTGTLTQNQLKLQEPFTVGKVSNDDLILAGALASRRENQDAIDMAVLDGLKDEAKLKQQYEVQHFMPFDPVHKRTEATVKTKDGKTFKTTKGAPQVILKLAKDVPGGEEEVKKKIEEFAGRGYRALGVARADHGEDWKFLGVLPLSDPPREDSKSTIQTAREMGVKLKMVTGDQVAIAKEIARQLGLGQNILDAEGFGETKQHESTQLADSIEKADGFAQVYPEHKYHIVEVLQQRKHITGMTGDGVNDAPALKKADVGIAVSGATDAARSAADIVLTTPGLSVIIDAIKEARRIFQRMNSYSIYRIAETVRVLLFMTLSILVFNFYPVTAVMIVLLALLNDGPILAIAYDRTRMSPQPEAWDMPLVLGISSTLGVLGVIASFGLFFLAERVFHIGREAIQTFMFLKLAVAGHLTIFLTRTRGPFWSFAPSGILFWSAVITKIMATLAAGFGILMAPVHWKWILLIWGYALAWFVVNDFVKLWAYKIFDRRAPSMLSKEKVRAQAQA